MKQVLRLLVVVCCCLAVAWISGATGRFLVVLSAALFGPGYLLERWMPANQSLPIFVRPVLWLGLSLSLIVLLYQWTTLMGLRLSSTVLTGLLLLLLLALVIAVWFDLRQQPRTRNALDHRRLWAWSGLLGIITLTLWTRFVQIAHLILPPWVDPVHHALLIRVAAETGQVPYSLLPYLQVTNLAYHWGYHVFAATLWQLSALSLPQLMLWLGQILNALHTLTCAALASYLWRRPLPGIIAALVVGLISFMPAYYVSWGRYTQLTGLLLIPPLAIACHQWLQSGSWRWLLSTAVLCAGLSMVHFRVLFFGLALLFLIVVLWLLSTPLAAWRSRLIQAVALGALGLGLAFPWITVIVLERLVAMSDPKGLVGGGRFNALNEGLLWVQQNYWLVALALLAAFCGLWVRSRATVLVVGWTTALVVMANLWLAWYLLPMAGAACLLWGVLQNHWSLVRVGAIGAGVLLLLLNPWVMLNPMGWNIPYIWLITNEIVVISLFLPFSLLIGSGAWLLWCWLQARWPQRWQPLLLAGAITVPVLLALWGSWNLRTVVNQSTILATPADMAAIDWVAQHTAADARFLHQRNTLVCRG
ncbi:MAG: hypothetical protein HC837_17760 [Chloroflexaceae bacterium]|nr:hypothetical protein [Chloroflexaceae bacterium]